MIALLIAALTATWQLLVSPAAGRPADPDAVVALGGDRDRLEAALDLATETDAPLVVSTGGDPATYESRFCTSPPTDIEVICFDPVPGTTRGEARAIGRLVDEHGWEEIAVVTSRWHLTRSRILTERCTDAEVVMVDAGDDGDGWLYPIVHEWGGLVSAALDRSC